LRGKKLRDKKKGLCFDEARSGKKKKRDPREPKEGFLAHAEERKRGKGSVLDRKEGKEQNRPGITTSKTGWEKKKVGTRAALGREKRREKKKESQVAGYIKKGSRLA